MKNFKYKNIFKKTDQPLATVSQIKIYQDSVTLDIFAHFYWNILK